MKLLCSILFIIIFSACGYRTEQTQCDPKGRSGMNTLHDPGWRKDTVLDKKICGHHWSFIQESTIDTKALFIYCDGSSDGQLQESLYNRGGDCNGQWNMTGKFIQRRDSLFIYQHEENLNTMDVRYEWSSYYVDKMIYVFRRNGELVCVSHLTSYDPESEVWKEVIAQTGEELPPRY